VIHSINKTSTNQSFYKKAKNSVKIEDSDYSPNAIICRQSFKKKELNASFRGKSKVDKIPKAISPIKTRSQFTQNINKNSLNKKKDHLVKSNNIPDAVHFKIKKK